MTSNFLIHRALIAAAAIVTFSCVALFITKKVKDQTHASEGEEKKKDSCTNEQLPHADHQPSSTSATVNPAPRGFDYYVFISFRGEDTRKGFAGHLHSALQQKGIKAFFDSEDLKKGERIGNLFGGIKRSAVFVPIFSQRYAESRWCLKEIAKIVDCKRRIFPVFYNIEPTDVKHQTGSFAKYFKKHQVKEDVETLNKLKDSLGEAANISGYVLDKDYRGYEIMHLSPSLAQASGIQEGRRRVKDSKEWWEDNRHLYLTAINQGRFSG